MEPEEAMAMTCNNPDCEGCKHHLYVLRSRAQVPAEIGDRAMLLFLFIACSYFFFQLCRWALTGFRIVGAT